ncbi:putative ABC transport system ATP-binding protein [Paucidesulfovibrio gracilis DSM 16080]|uniref:Putative ABC transport system ATP-binding protein n=1 Tax=Paucidesulfovibrio gracilis DSM 16080 TaxID=1121449 RepID=A0A1T4WNV1_9BACT|nr:ATP-binding cassette domain-containing protein [Paucidesulfovibrio gracilis]SKA78565.1 putative ABC transport system ATP-binding protein [Paucidesulfovibrio gracilis DSM 16080]
MIHVKGLSKFFNRGEINEVLALREVSLDVREGDFITVIGSNGAGKSTFLNALAGVFPVEEGNIAVADQNVTNWPEHRRAAFLGRVFQDPLLGTCPHATIEQNLALAAKRGKSRGLRKGVRRADRALFREKLAMLGLGLEDRLTDATGLLSGGQRQALTMLMATLVRPKVLLLDEHTAALDPKTAVQIMELTDELIRSERLTTLMVTHNMAQAIAYGNRLVMFHQGRIILDIEGEEKAALRVPDLLERFHELGAEGCVTDRALLG